MGKKTSKIIKKEFNVFAVLQNKLIIDELDKFFLGYNLKSIEKEEGTVNYIYDKATMALDNEKVVMTKMDENSIDAIIIDKEDYLEKHKAEKRYNGVKFTIVFHKYSSATRFENETVLVDLWELSYLFTKEKVESLCNKNYDKLNINDIYLVMRKLYSEKELYNSADKVNTFATHMNYYINNHFIDNCCSSRTYLNTEEVSNYYDIVNGTDKLYRIYDLYNGIINERNLGDLKAINLGLLSSEGFALKDLKKITAVEETLVGKSNDELSPEYIEYVRKLLHDNFAYDDNLEFDRESLVNAIRNYMSASERSKRYSEEALGLQPGDFDKLDIEEIEDLVEKKTGKKLGFEVTGKRKNKILNKIFK